MEIPLLKDIVIILALSMVVVYVSQRLKLPVIVGLLLTGVVAGPNALGLINNLKEVDMLAKIGVVLLLFTIGIEFSLSKLLKIKSLVLIGGTLQVALTIGGVYLVTSTILGWPFGKAMFMGFLISLSSTAIVLKVLQDRAEMDSSQGRISLGILIFQDVIVVFFIILTPFLAGEAAGSEGAPIWRLMATGIGLLIFVGVGSRYIVPWILRLVVRTRSRELFLLTVGGICFAVAFVAAELSLALGAFLAGLTISESEYSHEAFEHILPFRDIFTSFFFVSVGMLLDLGFIIQNPILVLLFAFGILLMKALAVIVSVLALGYPLKTAVVSGLILCQVGEFAFILAQAGSEYNLLSPEANQMFLAVSVLSMAATSFIITGAAPTADLVLQLPIPKRLRDGLFPKEGISEPTKQEQFKDHVVIIGFGINGRNVARAATRAGVPYVVLEMNPDTVREGQARGRPIFYGDATQEAVLQHLNIEQARTVVIVIADAAATRRITGLVHKLNPQAHIIARTRFLSEMQPLQEIGANEVIPEEFETSVEIFSRVLHKYHIPPLEINKLVTQIRADGYKSLRTPPAPNTPVEDLQLQLPNFNITTMLVDVNSMLRDKTVGDLDMRKRTGLTLLAIRREGEIISNIGPETRLQVNDELFLMGEPVRIINLANSMFEGAVAPLPNATT